VGKLPERSQYKRDFLTNNGLNQDIPLVEAVAARLYPAGIAREVNIRVTCRYFHVRIRYEKDP
jgi:hypothetical protein